MSGAMRATHLIRGVTRGIGRKAASEATCTAAVAAGEGTGGSELCCAGGIGTTQKHADWRAPRGGWCPKARAFYNMWADLQRSGHHTERTPSRRHLWPNTVRRTRPSRAVAERGVARMSLQLSRGERATKNSRRVQKPVQHVVPHTPGRAVSLRFNDKQHGKRPACLC